MEIILKNDKLKETMTDGGEMNHLGDLWPFENAVLHEYFGEYYKPETQKRQQRTTSVILNQYMKYRPAELCASLMNPVNPNFFLKREILWKWLELHEETFKLPFKSKDGREGKPFEEAMPDYANLGVCK
jgi:hypothetical protein